MPHPLFSPYRQGENRVTGTFMAVLERLSLPNIDRILRTLLGEDSLSLVSFENQVKLPKSVPDAAIRPGTSVWIETKTSSDTTWRCQIENHLKGINDAEGGYLLVLTPDDAKPEVLDQVNSSLLNNGRVQLVWSNFTVLHEVANDIIHDEDDPPTEREAFLLRELALMLRNEGLVSDAKTMVVVVAASHGWPMYQAIPVYRCALSLSVRSPDQFDYIGFYAGGEIKRIVPKVEKVVESINLTRQEERDALDADTKQLAEDLWQRIRDNTEQRNWFDGSFKVMFLSEPDDPGTINLGKSIRNDKQSSSGRTVPFTYGKPRYVSLESLQDRNVRTTTELERLERR